MADGMRRLVLCSVMSSASGLIACDGAETRDAASEPAGAARHETAPADAPDEDDPTPTHAAWAVRRYEDEKNCKSRVPEPRCCAKHALGPDAAPTVDEVMPRGLAANH